jgi:hypothetical protein
MSWSFSGMGKPLAVMAKARKDLSQYKCLEPEEAIKNHILDIIDLSLSAYPSNAPVRIEASGSQHKPDSAKPDTAINNLSVSINPLYGFIE